MPHDFKTNWKNTQVWNHPETAELSEVYWSKMAKQIFTLFWGLKLSMVAMLEFNHFHAGTLSFH